MTETAIPDKIDQRIVLFLNQNSVLTLAVSQANIPYCASCFYVFSEERNVMIFKSKRETDHIQYGLQNPSVSGTILPGKLDMTKVQGIQFRGRFSEPDPLFLAAAKKLYYRKYPFALAFHGDLWAIELNHIKFTDNSLGFGNRLEWTASKTNHN